MKLIFMAAVLLFLVACSKEEDDVGGDVDVIVDDGLAACLSSITVPDEEVTEIDCRYRGIADVTGISKYKNLRALDLTGNQLVDLRPMQGLSNLEGVLLVGNPIDDYSTLKGFSKLNHLSLSFFNHSDIQLISSISSIQILSVAHNELTAEMVSELEALTSLHMLSFDATGMSYFPDLSNLKALIRVSVRQEGSLSDMSNIKRISGLKSLMVSGVDTEVMSFLSELHALEFLTVANMDEFDVTLIQHLNNLDMLHFYHLSLLGDVRSLVDLPDLSILKMGGVKNLSCSDSAYLQEYFDDIYFFGIEEELRTCVQ